MMQNSYNSIRLLMTQEQLQQLQTANDAKIAKGGLDCNDAKKFYASVVSRRRQRNEICVTLKRSSIIHDVYIGKNCIEVLLVFLFLFVSTNKPLIQHIYFGDFIKFLQSTFSPLTESVKNKNISATSWATCPSNLSFCSPLLKSLCLLKMPPF